MIIIKYLKYFLVTLVIALFAFLPLRVRAEESEPIEINRKVSLTYADITAFNYYPQEDYTLMVYHIENFFTRYNIDNKNGLYPYSISLKSQLSYIDLEANQNSISELYKFINGNKSIKGGYYLIVSYNDIYILIDSTLNPPILNTSIDGFIVYWTDFNIVPGTNELKKHLRVLKSVSGIGYTISSITHQEFFNTFGFYLEFIQVIYNEDDIDFKDIYDLGFEDGKEIGRIEGYNDGYEQGKIEGEQKGYSDGFIAGDNNGYSRGYKEGKEYGLANCNGDVNALSAIIPNIVGTIWGVMQDFLSIEVYGISAWKILSALSSVALVLLAIKLFK